MSRKLDALFAEKVLGCEIIYCDCKRKTPMLAPDPPLGHRYSYCCTTPGGEVGLGSMPPFDRSLDAAWLGVEKLRYFVELEWDPEPAAKKNVRVVLTNWRIGGPVESCHVHSAKAPTAALAVLKACLLAVGVSQEEIDEAAAPAEREVKDDLLRKV